MTKLTKRELLRKIIPVGKRGKKELKNNKIEEDLDRGLSGGVGGLGVMSSHSSLTSGYQSSLASGPSSLGSLQPSLQSPLR